VLVTHDRFMLDRLSTTLLAMDGRGGVEFFAELAQWELANAAKKAPAKSQSKDTREAPANKKKLSYMETREYEQIEDRVATAEELLDAKRQQLEMPEVVSNPTRLMQASAEIDAAQEEVDKLYARWAELEAKRA
jgi:ATP-binding cassette subfamily F protein uup